MGTVLEVIAQLAKTPISRDILERTRLGREINNIRRQNKNEELNRRAKDLVREWRRVVADEESRGAVNTSSPATVDGTSNGNSNGHVSHNSPPTAATNSGGGGTAATNMGNSGGGGSTAVGLSAAARALAASVRSGEQSQSSKHAPYPGESEDGSHTSGSVGKKRPRTAPVSPALNRNLPAKKDATVAPAAFNRERLMDDVATKHRQSQGYAPLSPAPLRPGTAPASPALSRGRPSSVVSPSSNAGRARHSAPNSPALVHNSQHMPQPPSNYSQNGSSHNSSSSESSSFAAAANAAQSIHPAPVSSSGGMSASRLTSPSLRDPARAGNAFSRTNVANKRLRKGEEPLTSDHHFSGEPPNKRQRLGGGVGEPGLPLTNGGIVEVEDSNSLGATSSGSSYCEVIDSFNTVDTDASRHSQHSSAVHKGHPQQTHHSRASSSTNSISDIPSNIQSKPRRGRPTSKSIPQCPSNLPTASDGSSLPGATRGATNRTNLPDSSHCPGSVNVPFPGVDNNSSSINNNSITPMRDVSNCNSLRGGSATGTPSSSRAGRGRGRRRSVVQSPATPEIRLPSTKSKVKTTSQLVAELAERKGDTLLAQRASKLEEEQKSHDEMARNKIDHVYRYVRSLPSPPDSVTAVTSGGRSSGAASSVAATPTPSPPPQHMSSHPASPLNSDMPASPSPEPGHGALEEEEKPFSILDVLGVTVDDTDQDILAKLPPVDFESAAEANEREAQLDEATYRHTEDGGEELAASTLPTEADDGDEDSGQASSVVVPLSADAVASVDRLHTHYNPGLRGTNDCDGVFREWHETLTSHSYMDQPLHLLPYVILDF